MVKGYRFRRSNTERAANEAIFHAGAYAFAHRRDKKGDFRRMWNVQLSSLAKKSGTSYSKLIGNMKKSQISLNRKMLASLAQEHPETFVRLVKKVS